MMDLNIRKQLTNHPCFLIGFVLNRKQFDIRKSTQFFDFSINKCLSDVYSFFFYEKSKFLQETVFILIY